jgi:hypothetical protein
VTILKFFLAIFGDRLMVSSLGRVGADLGRNSSRSLGIFGNGSKLCPKLAFT